ncbi:MAG: ABC transporter substrate-binding protein [Planctomycetaceae bacterium]
MLRPTTHRRKSWLVAIGVGMAAAFVVSSTTAHAQRAGEAPSQTPNAQGVSDPSAAETDTQPQAPEEQLPKLEEMQLPTAEQLLRDPQMDWVVLKRNQEVIVAEPVTPRPDTLLKMQTAIDERSKQRRNLSGEALAKHREELDAMSKLRVRLPDQAEEDDYLLPMKLIEQIIHHEDLVLRRIDELIKQEKFDLAYELLNILRRNTPDWPGALDRHNALLFAEASRKIVRGEYESALAALEEVHSRTPQYPGLAELTGTVIHQLVENAVAAGDWRRARHFHRRIRTLFPDHPLVGEWRSRFNNRAEEQLSAAEQARAAGDHGRALTHAEQAASIWPATRNLRARYRSFADRYQRLHVAVLDLPVGRDDAAIVKSQAAERAERLNEIRFFEVDYADEGSAHYNTRFCDRWEPLNLGREVLFELRDSRQPWEAQPIVAAPVIAEQIAARLNPSHPAYDERLAGYVGSLEVHSPLAFTLRFDRVPVRIEALLTIPVVDAADEEASQAVAAGTSPVSVASPAKMSGGFARIEQSADRAVYRRVLPEPEDARLSHLTELQEHRYPDSAAALQALLRGDVSMLVRPPAWIVDMLRSDEELLKAFFVERMAVPITHVVQIHPRSKPLKNREYRRALAYGVDRRRILTETVLRSGTADLGRVVNGPLPSRSDANNALVQTRPYDPLAAVSLTLAARQQLGGELPSLRMVVVDDPVVQAAARRLVESWSRFGITVEMVSLPDGPLMADRGEHAEWDLLYRTVQLTEPATQLWPFLTLTGRARVADLDPFPDWLRQEIIALDLASDWRGALQSLNTLHLHLWGEVMLLPLWEVDDYLIYRKHVRGVPVSPVHPYEDVDRWVVEAWYPEDEP